MCQLRTRHGVSPSLFQHDKSCWPPAATVPTISWSVWKTAATTSCHIWIWSDCLLICVENRCHHTLSYLDLVYETWSVWQTATTTPCHIETWSDFADLCGKPLPPHPVIARFGLWDLICMANCYHHTLSYLDLVWLWELIVLWKMSAIPRANDNLLTYTGLKLSAATYWQRCWRDLSTFGFVPHTLRII